jgi:hypothetical protein
LIALRPVCGRLRDQTGWIALLAVLVLLVAPACGGDKRASAAKIEDIPLSAMPAELLGMKVEAEKAAELVRSDEEPFIEDIGLFSLRRDDLLQATIQISRFTAEARLHDRQFRDTLANQVSTGNAEVLRMDDTIVYMSAGETQSLAVWFKDRSMFILATRTEFKQPRALLRKVLEIPG